MQTLRDVFRREDERLNLVNVGLCIALVVALVVVAFGIQEMKFVMHKSPAESPTPTTTQPASDGGD